jgi:3,4-dihydroxy 2-butanone 4-phosphate synthase/GTP cyclohydrolase II
VVVLRYPESPRHFVNAVNALRTPVDEIGGKRDGGSVLRTYGTGSQIVHDLGVTRMRVLSAPKQMHAISGFGLEIVEYIEN